MYKPKIKQIGQAVVEKSCTKDHMSAVKTEF